MKKNSRILITGGSGLLGKALVGKLESLGFETVFYPTSKDLDLLSFEKTLRAFCETYTPEYVFHLAGVVYGLGGNLQEPARIFVQNTLINTHVIEAARQAGVKKILGMGSICAYPSPFPGSSLTEDMLFFGEPHPGERAYGSSKRALLAQLEASQSSGMDYAFAISSNLYGPNDHFNLETGHVVPSLIRKVYEAKNYNRRLVVWGDGNSTRDIMHSWDAATALILIMAHGSGRYNLASGRMLSIKNIVALLSQISGLNSLPIYDASKPKGHEFPGINIDRLLTLGFQTSFIPETGLENVYRWYADNVNDARNWG